MIILFRPNFLKIAAFLASLIFVTVKVNATHIVGGEVYYDCLGFNSASQTGTYRVTLLVYRDCSSSTNAAFDNEALLGVYSRTGNVWSEFFGEPQPGVPIGVTTTLPITTSDPCLLPPTNLCYQRATYTTTVTLPYDPNGYVFSYSRCCRNGTINNITAPGTVGGTYDAFLSGPAQLACNSSPRFSGLPPTAVCLNEPLVTLQSATEPNGVDQISYSLCSAQIGNGQGNPPPAGYFYPTNISSPFFNPVSYVNPTSASNPIITSPSNPVIYNPTTGQLSFTPSVSGQYVVAMCVTETRNGVVMSYSRREFQFNVVVCTPNVNAIPHTSATPINGTTYGFRSCDGNVITFNNPSNDATQITSYRWQFNLGGSTTFNSTARFPTVTFPGTGTYTGFLVCNPNLPVGNNCRDSTGIVVNIFPPRDAAFSISTDSCNAAASITFTNQSTAQGTASPIRSYAWSSAFSSTLANPTWRPNNAGSFSARLMITDANGCTNSETTPFNWFPRSNVSITNNTRQGCRPLNVTFTNSSTPYASSYVSEWTFGDNSPTFTGQTPPAKVYNTPGNYYVRLRITSPWGCVSQDSVLIRVFDTPTANFTSSFDSCSTTSSPVLYTNRSTTGTVNAGALSAWNWTFTSGTPSTSTAQNPALVSYPTSGNYNTTLRVTDVNGCTNTVSRTLAYAPEPIQPTVLTPQTICLNASATFSTFNYPAAYSVTWAFGDNSTLTSRNPSKQYATPGTYVVTLTVRSGPVGYCSATFTTAVTVVDLPRASFTYRFDSCALTPVVFTNTSTRNPLGGNLTSWNWNFGGGQTATGIGPHNVTYPSTGNYTAILTVTDANGCTNTATQNIPWLPEPVVASGPSNQFFCLYGSYSYFTNVNLPANYTVLWEFGDTQTSTLRNGTHSYSSPGTYRVTMTATSAPSRFCRSTVFATATVHDVPRSSFRYNYDSCATGPVRYIDQSTRGVSAPINNWSWTFASGTPSTSSLQNPTVTYTNTGTYTTTLRVRDSNGCTATSSQSVPWIPEPIAPIVIPNQTLCLGQTATFNTPTYPSGYQIVWNFGDGTTATQVGPQAGPTRRYTLPGTYVVTAVVTSAPRAFCTNTFTTTVTINDNPTAGFRFRYDSCAIGPVRFFDASTLGTNNSPLTQWNWTFGNSTNPNIQNPTVTYATTGTYTVNLTVTNANGCASTVTRSVPWVPEPIAPIVIPNQTLCLGQTATFTIPTYSNGYRIRWNFGDGTTVTQVAPQATPTRRYTAPGVYVVTIDVLSAPQGFCTTTFSTTVTVNDNPTANFRFRYDSCAVGPVSFFDASTLGTNASPLAQWSWAFGNNTNSTLQNPTVTYATTGSYNVNLTVTNANGCSSTSTQAVPWVPEPISTVTLPNQFICLGFPVNYTIPSYPASYQVRWSWGDGVTTTQASGQTSATHTYTNPGIYSVSLSIVSGPQGFCNNTFLGNVTVNGLPTANFTFRYDSCAFAPVFFTDASTRSVTNNAINTWNWSFGDSQTSTIQNPNNLYATNGTYNVTLSIIDAAGCTSTVSRPVVYIPEPITPVALPLTATCFGDSMRFTNPAYPSNYTWVWNFGDGVTTIQNNPSHLYAAPGTYNVSFTVTSGPNGFCSYQTTASYVVNTRPIAQFSYTFDTCAIDSVRFLNTSLRNAANDPHATYNWDFNDLSFATQSPPSNRISHLYTNSGTYRIGLTVTDVNGCLDSTYRSVQWYPEPIVAVSVSDVEVCFGDTVRFVNSSYPIRGYTTTWNFGDGGTSPLPSPNYVYNTHGTFNTRLDIISPTGWCRDSFNVQVIVHQRPTAQFAYNFDTCAIDSVRFNNTSFSNNVGDGLTRFDWAWGDGVVTTQFPPNRRQSYLYTNSDSFYVRLLINDINGCTDSTTQLVPWFPEPIVQVSVTDAEVCFGDTVRFVNNSYPIRGYTTTWNFGDGGTSPLPSPNYVFNRFGTFTSRLNIISPTGWCRDSFSTQVIVHERPDADFRIRYDSCSLAPVRFINDSRINTASDAFTSYNWTFGDNNGNTQTVPLSNVQTYQYTVRGPYTVALTVTDINGCTDTTSRAFRWVPEPIPGFILPDQQACDGQSVQFNNPVLPTGYIINWNFGDTQSSNISNPRHTYGAYGLYNARVQISSVPSGFCTFRDTAQITIHQLPTAAYRFRFDSCAIGDVRLMNDSRTNLANNALAQYQWNFGDASPILTQNTPLPSFIAHTYTTRNTYATGLTVTDANGCSNTASLSVPWLPEPINPFTLADQQACDYRQLLQFTNAAQPATYGIRWQFGDGAISTTSSPQHSYGTYGVYTATVSVTSAPSGFCTYRDTAVITVHQLPTAAYRFRFDSCAIGMCA